MRVAIFFGILLIAATLAPTAVADRCTAVVPVHYDRASPSDVRADEPFTFTMSFDLPDGYLACVWEAEARIGVTSLPATIVPTASGIDVQVDVPGQPHGLHQVGVRLNWDYHQAVYRPQTYYAAVKAHGQCIPDLTFASPTGTHAGPSANIRAMVEQLDDLNVCTLAIEALELDGAVLAATPINANDAAYVESDAGPLAPGEHTVVVTGTSTRTLDSDPTPFAFSWTFNSAVVTLHDETRPTGGLTVEDHGIVPVVVQRVCIMPIICTDPIALDPPVNYDLTTSVGALEIHHAAETQDRSYGPYRADPAPGTICPNGCWILTPILDIGWSDVNVSTHGNVAGQSVDREVTAPGQRFQHDAYPIP